MYISIRSIRTKKDYKRIIFLFINRILYILQLFYYLMIQLFIIHY